VDERDHHLLTSVNSLSCEEWDRTFGWIWRECIKAGALTAMVGHIMLPAYSRKLNPALQDKEILPASLSPELIQGLLREQLGFQGLIVTDASTMAGMTIPMPRRKAVPHAIAAGADMFLFTWNLQADYDAMCQGVYDGVITPQRLDDAVTRILATKAALGLHHTWEIPLPKNAGQAVGTAEHKAWAAACADRAVTLVKEEPGVLPISPAKTPRILYYPIEAQQGFAYSVRMGVCDEFKALLEEEGFQVTVFEPAKGMEGRQRTEQDFVDHYDLAIYCLNMATKSNQTTVRIEWQQPMGANCPHYSASIPTIAVSMENPYHLLDLPRIKTFINAYASTPESLQAVIDKLMGRSEFHGTSPADPFCGLWDTHL
jgi:beta-N-acetylhexosaminidase